jgi:hypothetical protein
MDIMDKHCGHPTPPDVSCATIPTLERLSYFFGQMLEPADFRAEQSYFRTQLSLLARYALGWGVACGFGVEVKPGGADGCEDRPEHERLVLRVKRGVAVDCCGRLIVLRETWRCCLWDLLGDRERTALLAGETLYVSVEHVETAAYPSRPVAESCDPPAGVQYGRIRDEARVVVSLHAPEHPVCDACLEGCPDPRLLLAGVRLTEPGTSAAVEVRLELRRLLARHELATITGVGWVHGGTYSRRSAEQLLTDGVGLRFSRPVRAASIAPGVVDLIVYEGGGGRRDAWYFKGIDLETAPGEELVDELTVRLSQPESFNNGDRILMRVRCDFILDECCRAVSGAHLGGGVPFDQALAHGEATHPEPAALPCEHPPDRPGPWRSGNGVEGGVWDSWVYVGNGGDYDQAAEGRAR